MFRITLHKPWKPAKHYYVLLMSVCVYNESMQACTGMIQPQIQMSISEERRDYLFSSPSLFYYFWVGEKICCKYGKMWRFNKTGECMGVHCVFKDLKYFTIIQIKNI